MKRKNRLIILFFLLISILIVIKFFIPHNYFREFYIVKIKNYSQQNYHIENQKIADNIIQKIYQYLLETNQYPESLDSLYENEQIPKTSFDEKFIYFNSDFFIQSLCYGNDSYYYGVCCYRFDIEIWDCSPRIKE